MKRTNAVVVRNLLQEQGDRGGEIRKDPYVINVDRERNCYSCGGFGHLAQNCKNWEIVGQERRIEYGNNAKNNLKEKKSLVVFN